MDYQSDTPFATIESAHEYLTLLVEAVLESKGTVKSDLARQSTGRHVDALRIIVYKLEKLERHLKTSCRIVNDLRTLRRLLLHERTAFRVNLDTSASSDTETRLFDV